MSKKALAGDKQFKRNNYDGMHTLYKQAHEDAEHYRKEVDMYAEDCRILEKRLEDQEFLVELLIEEIQRLRKAANG